MNLRIAPRPVLSNASRVTTMSSPASSDRIGARRDVVVDRFQQGDRALVTPMARQTTAPAMPVGSASTEALYGEAWPTMGTVPVIKPGSWSDLQDFNVFVPADRELSMTELRRLLVQETYRRNGFAIPDLAGVDLGKADPVGAATRFTLSEVTAPDGSTQKGYRVGVPAEAQRGYLQRVSSIFPATTLSDVVYTAVDERARKGEMVTDEQLSAWGVNDEGMRAAWLDMSRLGAEAFRLANGEVNPALDADFKETAARLRDTMKRSGLEDRVEAVIARYERLAGMDVRGAVTPRFVLASVAQDYSSGVGFVVDRSRSGLADGIRADLAARGITEPASIDAVVRTATAFFDLRDAVGSPAFAARRQAFDAALQAPAFRQVASPEEIARYRKAADALGSVDGVEQRRPRPAAFAVAEERLTKLDKLARYVASVDGFTNAGILSNAAALSGRHADRLRQALALDDSDPQKLAKVTEASEQAWREVLSFFKGVADPAAALEKQAQGVYDTLRTLGDYSEMIPGPVGLAFGQAFKQTENGLRYARGDVNGYELAARVASDAIKGALSQVKIPGGMPQKAVTAFVTELVAKAGPNIVSVLSNGGNLSPRAHAEAISRAIAGGVVDAMKAAAFSMAKGANGFVDDALRQKIGEYTLTVADKMGVTQWLRGPVRDFVDRPTPERQGSGT